MRYLELPWPQKLKPAGPIPGTSATPNDNGPWVNMGGLLIRSDSDFATVSPSSGASQDAGIVIGFGFSIPPLKTIEEIGVSIVARDPNYGFSANLGISLYGGVDSHGPIGNVFDLGPAADTFTTYSLVGTPGDWGVPRLTIATINDYYFGLWLYLDSSGLSDSLDLSYATI